MVDTPELGSVSRSVAAERGRGDAGRDEHGLRLSCAVSGTAPTSPAPEDQAPLGDDSFNDVAAEKHPGKLRPDVPEAFLRKSANDSLAALSLASRVLFSQRLLDVEKQLQEVKDERDYQVYGPIFAFASESECRAFARKATAFVLHEVLLY